MWTQNNLELCVFSFLETLSLDASAMTYPPPDICSEGTEAIQQFLCRGEPGPAGLWDGISEGLTLVADVLHTWLPVSVGKQHKFFPEPCHTEM